MHHEHNQQHLQAIFLNFFKISGPEIFDKLHTLQFHPKTLLAAKAPEKHMPADVLAKTTSQASPNTSLQKTSILSRKHYKNKQKLLGHPQSKNTSRAGTTRACSSSQHFPRRYAWANKPLPSSWSPSTSNKILPHIWQHSTIWLFLDCCKPSFPEINAAKTWKKRRKRVFSVLNSSNKVNAQQRGDNYSTE